MSFVEVANISKYYGDKTALKDVSFSLHQGQVLQVQGNNGAGKSTLLRLLSGLELPDAGQINIAGFSLENPLSFQRLKLESGIGYFNSSNQLYSHLSIRENLQLSSCLNDVELSEVLALCDRFSISAFLDYLPNECSSGTLKKVAILRATLHKPKLLLLDEPFVHLDQISIKLLREYFIELIVSGVSLVLVSHQEITFDSKSLVLDRGTISGT